MGENNGPSLSSFSFNPYQKSTRWPLFCTKRTSQVEIVVTSLLNLDTMLFSRSLQFYHLIPLLVGLAYSPTTQAAPISVDGSLLTQVSRLEIRTPNGDVVVKGSATPSPQVPHREVPDRRASLGSLSELSSLPLPRQSPVQSPPRRSSEGGGLGGLTNVLQSLTISGQGSSMSEHPAKPSTPNTNGQGSNGMTERPLERRRAHVITRVWLKPPHSLTSRGFIGQKAREDCDGRVGG